MDAMDDMLLGEFDPEVDKERNAVFQADLTSFQNMVKDVVRAHKAARSVEYFIQNNFIACLFRLGVPQAPTSMG